MWAPWVFRGLRRAYLTRLVTTDCATMVPFFARADVVTVQVPFFTPSLQANGVTTIGAVLTIRRTVGSATTSSSQKVRLRIARVRIAVTG